MMLWYTADPEAIYRYLAVTRPTPVVAENGQAGRPAADEFEQLILLKTYKTYSNWNET